MKHKILIIASLLTLISACSQGVESTPQISLSTAVALTGQAIDATVNAVTPTVLPTETFLPTVSAPSTERPTVTPTFEAGFTELAQIHFLSPGPMSSLISPFNLQVMLISGESELVQVDLLGEDGRVLQRDVEKVVNNSQGIFRNFRLTFEIRAVSEAGYIRISSKDDFGRIQALNTMPVLLYSIGSAQVNPVGNMIYERVMLDGMKAKQEIFGGELKLKGRLWPFNDQPVFVELFLPDGRPVGSRILTFDGIDTQEFETTLPYKVTEPTMARLTFRQDNPLLSVTDSELQRYIYVYTMEVMLNP
jgi:hypothetical protein